MQIRKILLVDDDDDIRMVGSLTLQEVGGWEVVEASSGSEALELAAAEELDLILLDVMMPEMDGPATFAKLRASPATASVPVIFLTAKVQRHEVERYQMLGAAGIVPKPFDPMTLPDQIRSIVAATRS